ncbi:hypothetical protein EBR96_09595, partial [bacterium]|nr:hypothetical protein [bacterium]
MDLELIFKEQIQLNEKINPTQERLNIQPLGYSDTLGNELSGGYILEMNINNDPGAWNSTYPPITQATCPHPVQFKHVYPAPDTIHPVQSNYIHAYVDSFENALNGVSYLSDSLNYRRWIDVGSFIDFLLLNEVSMNYQ